MNIVWNGSNRVGKADEEAEDAEDALMELLRGLHDHAMLAIVWDVEEWLFASAPLESHWCDQPLKEAVRALQSEAKSERVVLNGDVETALLDSAYGAFQDGEEVSAVHVATLLQRGMIDADDAEQWRDETWRHLPSKQA
ncbi:hypothetical protein [Cupriavidus necator]|uniref:hypothetical protein n=1 Tax=Cupriavidus necator TaxID=106590 RepID=UPI000F4E9A87|nr:hypothetical protein [Cupriavidus necator]